MNGRIRLRPGVALTKSALGLIAGMALTGAPAPAAWAKDGTAVGTYDYAAPGCQQIVNSYGQIVYRCPSQP